MVMIASGIVLTAMIRRKEATKTQNKWLAYFPPKFFMSLLLTPISEKLAFVFVGNRKQVGDDDTDMSRYSYQLTQDWQQTIRMFRLGIIVMLFVFSAHVRWFREENKNF